MGKGHKERNAIESRWGLHSCAGCGATIVLGEHTAHVVIDGHREILCSVCASQPQSVLHRRLPVAA